MFIKPDYNLKNIYEINFEELKQQGIKCIMFDLDSTVMLSKSASFLPETVEWFNSFINDFEVAIISNNKSKAYIENASKLAPCRVIGHARKPNPQVAKKYLEEINVKHELNDDEVIAIIAKQIKTRKESIIEFEKGNRQDLIDNTNKEIEILSSYMPEQMSKEEIEKIINETFEKINPTGPSDMGKIMGMVTPILRGKADMSEVSKIIKERLAK